MLKRQRETAMLSSSSLSSSRRQNLQQQHQNHEHSVKPIGCLSGILHLVSKHQRHRRRRFLTFGKKQGKYRDVEVPINSSSPSEKVDNKVLSGGNQIGVLSSSSTTLQVDEKKKDAKKEDRGGDKIRHARSSSCQVDGGADKIRHARSLSCQVLRSPTLSVEIRQSDSVLSPDNFSEPTFKDGRSTTSSTNSSTSTVVGVDEKESTACSSAEEKRRMLLGALEKCDEDLKAIKNIIEALQTSPRMERRRGINGEKFEAYGNVKEFKQSPIFVLPHDFLSPPPATLNSTTCFSKRHITYGQTMQQQKPQPRKKNPRQEDMITSTSFFHRITTIGVSIPIKREIAAWSSKAIGESVVEVCNDVDCGERREVTRIGLVLQDFVLKDLLDQVVKELLLLGRAKTSSTCLYSSLPFEACKKKLRF